MKKRESKIILAVAAVILLVVLCLSMCHKEKKPGGAINPENTTESAAESGAAETPTIAEPGEVPVDIAEIPGFEPDKKTDKKPDKKLTAEVPTTESAPTEAPETEDPKEPQPTAPAESRPEEPSYLSDRNLSLDALGGYSGNYLEDGTDDLVNNVAAIVVTNHSNQMLQVADITFRVNDTETAEFRITDLPAGMTVLALEQNRRPYSKEDDYSYGQTATGYMDMPTLSEDTFTIVTDTAGKLTLKNKVDRTFDKVYVYYKYVQQGGVYLGGITYRVPFENLKAGGEITETANHFDPANSRVVDLEIAKE